MGSARRSRPAAHGILKRFGYDVQRSSPEDFDTAVGHVKHAQILRNLNNWLSKLGLDKEPGANSIRVAILSRLEKGEDTA